MVEYIINTFGKDKLNHLLVLLNDGNTMDDALLKTYNFNLSGLDAAWIESMTGQPEEKAGPVKLLKKESPRDVLINRLTPRVLTPALTAGAG